MAATVTLPLRMLCSKCSTQSITLRALGEGNPGLASGPSVLTVGDFGFAASIVAASCAAAEIALLTASVMFGLFGTNRAAAYTPNSPPAGVQASGFDLRIQQR